MAETEPTNYPGAATLPQADGSFFISGTNHQLYRLGQKLTPEDFAAEPEPAPLTVGRKWGSSIARKAGGGTSSGPGSGFRGSVSLADLVRSGVLLPGRGKISCTYKGNTVTAALTEDGAIEHQGRLYQSATAFSINFKRTITPSKQGDDGWKSVLRVSIEFQHF